MRTSYLHVVAAALCAASLVTASATGQERDRAAGEALFQAGRALMDSGQYEAACKKFEASNKSDPAVGTVLNLANCLEKVGRLASAWQRFEEAVQKLKPGDERLQVAKDRAAALKARLPTLELTLEDGAPPDAQVIRDGVPMGSGALDVAIPIDPGSHRIVVKAAGHADAEITVELREGRKVKRRLAAGAPIAGAPVAESKEQRPPSGTGEGHATPPLAPAEGGSWWTGKRAGGVAAGGVGAIFLALGIGEGVVAMGKKNIVSQDCNTTSRTCTNQGAIDAAADGRTASMVSTVGFVVGGAALAAGVTLIAIGAPEKAPVTPTARVGAVWLPGGGAVGVSGAF